jgi:hypothetical protein
LLLLLLTHAPDVFEIVTFVLVGHFRRREVQTIVGSVVLKVIIVRNVCDASKKKPPPSHTQPQKKH